MLILFLWYLVPVWDHFATTVAVGVFGRHGATQDLALRGSWSEWPRRVHDKERVSSERFGPPVSKSHHGSNFIINFAN